MKLTLINEERLNLLKELASFSLDDLTDIRRALVESQRYLENVVNNVKTVNEVIYDIFRYAEVNRRENFVKVGVYYRPKLDKLVYHVVSDEKYEFAKQINTNWELQYEYELEVPRPMRINRFIIDLEFWLAQNT